MTSPWAIIENFGISEEGASLVEYALFLALITLLCIASITLLGSKLSELFSSASTSI
jgi:Flp pilus assembly pilin Flp